MKNFLKMWGFFSFSPTEINGRSLCQEQRGQASGLWDMAESAPDTSQHSLRAEELLPQSWVAFARRQTPREEEKGYCWSGVPRKHC